MCLSCRALYALLLGNKGASSPVGKLSYKVISTDWEILAVILTVNLALNTVNSINISTFYYQNLILP